MVRPVLDVALQRPEVDPRRTALMGWSLGGYLALRAATGEHRLAACIADPALFGIAEGMAARMRAMGVAEAVIQPLPDLDEATLSPMGAEMQHNRVQRCNGATVQRWTIQQRGFWVHGVRTLPDYLRVAAEFTLAGRLEGIDCPPCSARLRTIRCRARRAPSTTS